jgi:hypothetical protein
VVSLPASLHGFDLKPLQTLCYILPLLADFSVADYYTHTDLQHMKQMRARVKRPLARI